MNKIFMSVCLFIACGGPLFSDSYEVKPSSLEKIHFAQAGFLKRWNDFIKGHQDFPLWNFGWKEEILQIRFNEMEKERWSEYFTNQEDFGKKALGLWKKEYELTANVQASGSRYPFFRSPFYAIASSNYNASLVVLHGLYFLAMEAPCEKNLVSPE